MAALGARWCILSKYWKPLISPDFVFVYIHVAPPDATEEAFQCLVSISTSSILGTLLPQKSLKAYSSSARDNV